MFFKQHKNCLVLQKRHGFQSLGLLIFEAADVVLGPSDDGEQEFFESIDAQLLGRAR